MTTAVSIPGIHCASCVSLIRDVSAGFPAIIGVHADLPSKRVTIEHSKGFNLESWCAEIESIGPTYAVKR